MTPRVTIVTAVLNAADRLPRCLASVASQDVPVEHVIVDGGSTDGTIEVLRTWQNHAITWSSGPDRGISDAFNNGIARAQGEIIGILNADDSYEPGAVRRALAALDADPAAAFAFGHCLHEEPDGSEWLNLADPGYARRLRYFMADVNHPTMFVRRSAYAAIGVYDPRWNLAMDYDWLLRADAAGMRGTLVDAVQARMAMGGVSDRHWIRACAEARRIAIAHGASAPLVWLDHTGRIVRGSLRRSLAAIGARNLVRGIRRARQRRVVTRKR